MAWNPLRRGILLSGSDDFRICIWDIEATNQNQLTQDAMENFEAHNSIVEDVSWNNFDENIFITVGDDKKMKIWDLRSCDKPTSSIEGHV